MASGNINGIPVPVNSDSVNFTGLGPLDGDFGLIINEINNRLNARVQKINGVVPDQNGEVHVTLPGAVNPPVFLEQTDPDQVVLTVARLFGTPHDTSDANLMEFRNSITSGTPGLGQLVSYFNEEGFFRIQNAQNSKTLFRFRNWGTNVNCIQITNAGGDEIFFNVTAEGFVTGDNIGIPIRGLLEYQEHPDPGLREGIYARRKTP